MRSCIEFSVTNILFVRSSDTNDRWLHRRLAGPLSQIGDIYSSFPTRAVYEMFEVGTGKAELDITNLEFLRLLKGKEEESVRYFMITPLVA